VLAVELLGSTAFVRSIGLEDVNKELSCAHDTGSLYYSSRTSSSFPMRWAL